MWYHCEQLHWQLWQHLVIISHGDTSVGGQEEDGDNHQQQGKRVQQQGEYK